MTLTPIEKRRLSDKVVDQLTDLIRSGELVSGSRLPSERELARMLGVSRTLIRESLRILESIGLIEVRPGVGAIVGQPEKTSLDEAKFLWSHPSTANEVLEVRLALGVLAAELAATRIMPEELTELEDLITAQRRAVDDDEIADLVRLDERFHHVIYRATRNNVLMHMLAYSSEVLENVRWTRVTLRKRRAKVLNEHQRILDALKTGDPKAASAASHAHFRRSMTEVQKLIDSRDTDGNSK